MDIADAQSDLRRAYVGGGPGAMVSGTVWGAAGMARLFEDTQTAFSVLFLGGMLIFPLSAVIARMLFRRRAVAGDNSIGAAALEGTIAMIGGLFAAWLFLPVRPTLVFPIAAIAVGTHYAVFRTVYGDRLFLLLAASVTCVGVAAVYLKALGETQTIFAVALIELAFGAILTSRALRA
jgi:hypothetical protein